MKVVLRLGSHAEKEYFEKLGHLFDGYILSANLIAGTPGASAGLVVKFSGEKMGLPYYVDPITHIFGRLHAPDESGDVPWLYSDYATLAVRRAFRLYGDELGGLVGTVLATGMGFTPEDLADDVLRTEFVSAVARFQETRLEQEFLKDPEYKQFATRVPPPKALFAPYFCIPIPGNNWEAWLALNRTLMLDTRALFPDRRLAAVLCAPPAVLASESCQKQFCEAVRDSKMNECWIWIEGMDELDLATMQLRGLRGLVERLSQVCEPTMMYGGFFSLLLGKHGLHGVSHGVGYSERKVFAPSTSGAPPLVRYYLPPIRRKVGVPEVLHAMLALQIETPDAFFERVCDCVICRGVLRDGIEGFGAFGESHLAKPTSTRTTQTPQALRLCRLHFLLRRAAERDLATTDRDILLAQLAAAKLDWAQTPILYDQSKHVSRWIDALA